MKVIHFIAAKYGFVACSGFINSESEFLLLEIKTLKNLIESFGSKIPLLGVTSEDELKVECEKASSLIGVNTF